MSNRYSLSQTDSPRPVYRVIDHSRDGGLSVRSWFATLTSTRAHQLPRWQDRYAAAAVHAPSAHLALERLQAAL